MLLPPLAASFELLHDASSSRPDSIPVHVRFHTAACRRMVPPPEPLFGLRCGRRPSSLRHCGAFGDTLCPILRPCNHPIASPPSMESPLQTLLSELRALLDTRLIADADRRRRYEIPERGEPGHTPAVLLPQTEAEIVTILQLCTTHG